MCPDLLEAPLALPVVAGGGEIAMLRHRHRDAAVVDPRVSAIASPRRAEALVHQVAVFRDLDLGAGAAPRHVADLALPAGEGGVGEKGMLRQVDRRAGAELGRATCRARGCQYV